MTRDEFLEDPNYHYYVSGEPIPDEWFVEAWETLPEFRDNVSYGIQRDVSKGLGLRAAQIEGLVRLLSLSRMIEMYERIRNAVPWNEPDFRPAFEELFGERMNAFPPALTADERERAWKELLDGAEPYDGIP